MTAWSLAGACLISLIASDRSIAAQRVPDEVEATLRKAREEIRDFDKAGGKKDGPNHPVEKWVPKLWAIHEKSPRTPDAAKAASEAVHLLIHADRFQEAQALADQLPQDDPAWESLPQFLFEAASLQKDFTYLLKKLQAILPSAPDPKAQAAIHLALGRGWRAKTDDEKAKAAFMAAIELARDSTAGRQAETELYELLHLASGQPAPQFSTVAVNGSSISLADYRGKPLVLIFWATT